MFVSGFTIVRNALEYDYPIVESILSALPLCDEFIVLVGKSSDETRREIEKIASPKVKIHDSIWDDSLRVGGRVLAIETNKAFALTNPEADWCLYLQADEVLHESSYDSIRQAMLENVNNTKVDALLFDYVHFYGSYNFIGADTRKWYPREIRLIKRKEAIFSYKDAISFRKKPNEKLCVKESGGVIHHYGWVKHPQKQQLKQESFHLLWHDEKWVDEHIIKTENFQYERKEWLKKFSGKHPLVMSERIKKGNWDFQPDLKYDPRSSKKKLVCFLEKLLRRELWRYKNYRICK